MRVAAILTGLALAFAACGGDDDEGGGGEQAGGDAPCLDQREPFGAPPEGVRYTEVDPALADQFREQVGSEVDEFALREVRLPEGGRGVLIGIVTDQSIDQIAGDYGSSGSEQGAGEPEIEDVTVGDADAKVIELEGQTAVMAERDCAKVIVIGAERDAALGIAEPVLG